MVQFADTGVVSHIKLQCTAIATPATSAPVGRDRDGLPNVVMEAMSQELPVVASATAAIPEIVLPGVTGLWQVADQERGGTLLDPVRASADLATVRWFEPMTRAYIEADPKLDEQAKATHLRGLDVWKARVEQDAQLAGVLK